MLHHGSVGARSKQNKRNLNLTLTLTLNLLLPSIVFIIKFVSLLSFLRLYHFYGLFTTYLVYEEVMSVRLYIRIDIRLEQTSNIMMAK